MWHLVRAGDAEERPSPGIRDMKMHPSRETSMKARGGASFPPDNEPLGESAAGMPESLGNVVKQSNAEK